MGTRKASEMVDATGAELREHYVAAVAAVTADPEVAAACGERFDRFVADLEAAADRPAPCDMKQGEPFDFAWCESHDTTFPLGGACKWHGRESVAEVLQDEVDEQRAGRVRAEIQLDLLWGALAGHVPVPCARCGVKPVLVMAELVDAEPAVCVECGDVPAE